MFIPEIIGFLSPVFSFISTAFMIWMIVDCVRNPKLVHKVGWVFFILITQFLGATVYFFARGPWQNVKQYLFPYRSFSRYTYPYAPDPRTTSTSQPAQDAFLPYERGYQVQQQHTITSSQRSDEAPEVTSLQPEYEEPLIMYPEPPQG